MPCRPFDPLARRPLLAACSALLSALLTQLPASADVVEMPALRGRGYGKPTTIYPDYVLTDSGLQYKDLREGLGAVAHMGDKVVVDWDGYTIGYYGRVIQAKNLAKGGAFQGNEEGWLRFTVGGGEVIPGIEEAIVGMREGSIRRILIPPGPLSYPEDTGFKTIGPVPSTFSGRRTLDFVVVNAGAIDKTLLFDIELLGVGPNAKTRRAEGNWLIDQQGK